MKKSTILITFLMLMTIGTFCSCSSINNKEVQNILETDNIDEIFVYHGAQWMGLRLDSDLASGITDKMDSFLKSPSNFMGSTDGEMYIKKLDAELTDLSDSDYVLVITLKNAMDFTFSNDVNQEDANESTFAVYGFCYMVNGSTLYLSTDKNISNGGTFEIGVYTEIDLSELNDAIINASK